MIYNLSIAVHALPLYVIFRRWEIATEVYEPVY